MKVLFLTRLFHPHIGGVEKHILAVSKVLQKNGHNITVMTENHGWRKTDIYEGIKIIRLEVGKKDWAQKFRIWKAVWKQRSFILQSDVIHCHDVFFWYMPFRFLYFWKKVYITFHGYESYPIRLGAIIIRKISEKLSNGNICIGDFITKWYNTKPTFVSYGGTEMTGLNISKKIKPSALFIGRLDEQTGINTYLEALTILKKRHSNFELVVIGEGKFKYKVKRLTKLFDFQEQAEKYFQDFQFAFVSRYLTILEALAAKKLVFAVYDNPIKEDYLKMAPFAKYIVISNNAKDLSNRVEYFLHNPVREKKMIEEGYKWVKLQTWEQVTGLYLALWQK